MATLRARMQDFFVDELVPERVAQEGEHLHVRIEKIGISTEEAIKRMARTFGVSPRSVGRCGRKDVRAVARQWFSFTGVTEQQVERFEDAELRVLEHVRLPRKLRMGRFLGNRFRIRVRDLPAGGLERAEQRLAVIGRRGLANAFGEQRLGRDGVNARIGDLLIQGRVAAALELYVEHHSGALVQRMRRDLVDGRWEAALKTLGRRRAGFLVSAWQAEVFNRVLKSRGDLFDQALEGDLLLQHSSGRLMGIEQHREAAQRVANFECSATGPLPGPDMRTVRFEALEIEAPHLPDGDVMDGSLRRWFGCLGARRALRVPVGDAAVQGGADDLGAYAEFSFHMPPGGFATTMLDEVLK